MFRFRLVLRWSSMRFVFVLLLAALVPFPSLADPAVSDAFRAEVSPELVVPTYAADASSPYYLWAFETRIINKLDVPLRVTRFGGQHWMDGQWQDPANWFGTQEFTEWYTNGDPVEDGWIQPGTVAVDARNWNRASWPVLARNKWVYRAVDAKGREYVAEVEPEFVPYDPGQPNWPNRATSLTTELKIQLTAREGVSAEAAQIRFGRYPGSSSAFAIYHGGEVFVDVPVPGLYWLDIFAPGYERVSVPLVLPDEPTVGELVVRMAGHGAAEPATLEFTGAGEDAGLAVAFYREWKPARSAYLEARTAYRDEYGVLDGFTYPSPPLANRLHEWIADDSRPVLARFAMMLSLDSPFRERRVSGERIFSLAPYDSPVWAFEPMLAGNATARAEDRSVAIQRFAAESPDPAVRARMLVNMGYSAKAEKDVERLTTIIETLRSDYAGVEHTQLMIEDLERADLLVEGQPIPDFELPTMESGVSVSTAALRGSYFLLHFWATWCAPCMAEMEVVHAAHEKFSGSGVTFVSVSMDHNREVIENMRSRRWPMPWTNIYWKDDPEFGAHFGISAIPALFLVDPDGVIVASGDDLHGEALMETLEEHTR